MIDGREEEKEFDVVMLGRIHEQKGVFELPGIWRETLKQRPEARLLIIGSGPHRAAMEEKFKELGVAESVTCAGSVDETRKNELLARSRIGLSLSYEEGWGLSVTEFLASALPVVAYRLPVFEQVFPDQLELIAPGDTAAAAKEIVALLNDDNRRLQRGSAGRDFAQKYDFREIAREELGILKRAANKS